MMSTSRFIQSLVAVASRTFYCLAVSCLTQLTLICLVLPSVLGQQPATTFTDPDSGVVFNSWGVPSGSSQTQGGFTFGVALPSDALTKDADEFIGYLVS